jgi:hypothetical protein
MNKAQCFLPHVSCSIVLPILPVERLECAFFRFEGHHIDTLSSVDHRNVRVQPPVCHIVLGAFALDASAIVIAHGLAGGNTEPSLQDFDFTRRLMQLFIRWTFAWAIIS